ncbi:MAG: hypothetical protein FJX35_17520 [Alphaproteobacteria bacterium]|nr:hypothetical protein [Alphaproteobacteria bacterium]
MRLTDPFPIAHQGLTPTHELRWGDMARKIIRDVLRLEPHERVIISADAYCGGAMLDALRQEIQRARGIELATMLHWTPGLTELRDAQGRKPDLEDRKREDQAIKDLFGIADVFIWLQNDWRSRKSTMTVGQSEWILETWPGRSVHFHWFHDPRNPDPESAANKAIDLVYQDAVLNLDYAVVKRTHETLKRKMSGQVVHVSDDQGTDIRFKVTDRFHMNHGDASRARISRMTSARDKEEEIPCGCFRTIPERDTVEGVISVQRDFGFPAAGYGLDVNQFFDKGGIRFVFKAGHVVKVETAGDQKLLDRLWAEQTGDKDRLGELVLGCNPLLRPVPGSGFQPYYGFGDAVLRLTVGENIESGGQNRSSLHRWLMLLNSTIRVNGEALVENGKLTAAGKGS